MKSTLNPRFSAGPFTVAGRPLAFLLAFLLSLLTVQEVFAITPDSLPNGRSYDQDRQYIQWNGSVSYVSLYHRDNTYLPASEGGANCNNGCTETVTRIQSGSSISGNLTYLSSINFQLAYEGTGGTGTATIRVCGNTIVTVNLYQFRAGNPGFNNFPSPAYSVPTSGACTWSISASGGFVDFRAVTTSYRAGPIVDLKINNSNGPLTLTPPGSLSLSWTSTNASTCSASGNWTGSVTVNGSQTLNDLPAGTYTYTLTCTNGSGRASDSVAVTVIAPLNGTLSVTHAKLLLYAPNLGQPAQSLAGTVSGGQPPYTIVVHVRTPSGGESTFSRSGSDWSVTPENTGDVSFGTTEKGTWTVWAELADGAGGTYRTSSGVWEVAWYPVHGRP